MRVLIADDHDLFRETLVLYLNRYKSDIEITLAKDFFDVLEYSQQSKEFDLIILDLCMPGMNGLDGLKACKQHFPNIPVTIMSGMAQPSEISMSLELGAAGFFPKTLSGKAFIKAIELVMEGERFAPMDYKPPPPHPYTPPPKTIRFNTPHLTHREKDVLAQLITGASNQDIADLLELKSVTIKLHVRNICRKLSAKNRTQAALIGNNLLQPKA